MLRSILFVLLFLAVAFDASESDNRIVLTVDSVGPMRIKLGMPISIQRIAEHFPRHRVTQEIRSGDSPDYHLFTVATLEGEVLVSFISYINDEAGYEAALVGLDEVVLQSPRTIDEYGVSPGGPISQAIKARKELEFGAGHMDNYFGKDRIWYLFTVAGMHGTQVSKQHAIESNPKIDVISWPAPRWR